MIKNNYIHTTTLAVSPINKKYQAAIYDHANTCLISLIHAMNSKNFGMDSIPKFVSHMKEYKEEYLHNSSPFILDSGGYSIIAGDVSEVDIDRFIDCYHIAMVELKDSYDYIFSLDIPVFINSKEDKNPNTKDNIGTLNFISLKRSVETIKAYPEIGEKFNMVLQWKMPTQFEIWDTLYDALELKNYVKSYSVGGLVGLLGMCPKINFAPFIGPCFYWLYRYKERGDFTRPLFIHLLGQYHKSARFTMLFLQELFSSYLKQCGQTCIITYDTINYSISSMFKTRVGVELHYIDEEQNFKKVHSYDLDEDDELFSRIYTTPDSLEGFHSNWDNIKADEPLLDTSFLIPMYVYSQLQLDKFYVNLIRDENIIGIFRSVDNVDNVEVAKHTIRKYLKPIFNKRKYASVITRSFRSNIGYSMPIILKFHHWVRRGMDKDELNLLMYEFIKLVDFPFDLEQPNPGESNSSSDLDI